MQYIFTTKLYQRGNVDYTREQQIIQLSSSCSKVIGHKLEDVLAYDIDKVGNLKCIPIMEVITE